MIAEPDAVATKVATLFSRAAARDYIDLAGILASGRYDREELVVLGAQADGGFTLGLFAQALAGVWRFPDDDFTPYGLAGEEIAQMREMMHSWSVDLLQAQEAKDLPSGYSPASPTMATPGRTPATGIERFPRRDDSAMGNAPPGMKP